ncbi:MAG: hypothetical protein Q9M13_01910, partial [Mariprofundales bacterium]|nr:hypothetical protein [Mariprofundales bacterium]
MKQLLYSLRSRIFFAVTALLIPASLLMGWLSIHQQTASFEQALIERGQLFARHLAYGAELPILTKDGDSLSNLLHKIIDENGVLFIEVYDAQGKLITAATSQQ